MQERPLDPPDHKPFTGRVTFAATVNDETVEVKADIHEDFVIWEASSIWWHGEDILPLLHGSQLTAIENQLCDRYNDIINLYQE